MAFLFSTQLQPQHFLSDATYGTIINGVKAERLFVVPLLSVAGAYAVSSQLIQSNEALRGNFIGVCGGWAGAFYGFMCVITHAKAWFPILSMNFWAGLFHWNAIKQQHQDTPWRNPGDGQKIAQDVWKNTFGHFGFPNPWSTPPVAESANEA